MKTLPNLRFKEGASSARSDVCAYLFKVCCGCQKEFLNTREITCLFEVDSGALSTSTCETIGQIVSTLIVEICHGASSKARGGRITVSLRRTGLVWILAVIDEGVRNFDNGALLSTASTVQDRVLSLNGTCRTRLAHNGAVTAVLFNTMPWQCDVMGLEPISSTINHPGAHFFPKADARSQDGSHQPFFLAPGPSRGLLPLH